MQKPIKAETNNFVGDRLLAIKEVAALTGLSVGTLYHFVSQGRIPLVRISRRCIRFRQSQIFEWWEKLSQPAVEVSAHCGLRLTCARKASKNTPDGVNHEMQTGGDLREGVNNRPGNEDAGGGID